MITELHLQNFKSFRNESITLSKSGVTVLVGPNGSGKSSVLDAAWQVAFAQLPGTLGPNPVAPLLRQGEQTGLLKAVTDLSSLKPGVRLHCLLELSHSRTKQRLYLNDTSGNEVIIRDSRIASIHHAKPFGVDMNDVWASLPFPKRFDVDLRKLRFPLQPPQQATSSFDESQVIQRLLDIRLGNDLNEFQRIVDDTKTIVPALKMMSLKRTFEDDIEKYGLQFSMSSGSNIEASQVSEGTLLAVALVTSMDPDSGRTLLLIDDLDHALHPKAQRMLVRLLKSAAQTQKLQVICTTHSPYILSEFAYEDVRVLSDVNGESKCKSLAEGPDAARWMKEIDAGEYWSFIEPKLFATS